MTTLRTLPELPRFEVQPPPLPDGNATIVSIASGASINAAITARSGVGNVIFELEAGGTWTEQVGLQYMNGPVLVRKAGAPQTSRATPATSVANGLPRVIAPAVANSRAVFWSNATGPFPSAWTFQDIDFYAPSGHSSNNPIIDVDSDASVWPTNLDGTISNKALRVLTSQIGLKRCLVRSRPENMTKVGINLGGRLSYVGGCWVQDFHTDFGTDSQGLRLYSGPGGFLVEDTVFTAIGWGEAVAFCGANVEALDVVPSDGIFRRCHFRTPRSYRGTGSLTGPTTWGVKNFIESKSSRRIRFQACILDYTFESLQNGATFMLWDADGNPSLPWCQTADWTIEDCWVKTVPVITEIAGIGYANGIQPARFHVNNILATGWGALITGNPNPTPQPPGPKAFWLPCSADNVGRNTDITIEHTTVVAAQGTAEGAGDLLVLDGIGNGFATSQWHRLTVRRNAWAGFQAISAAHWAALNAANGDNTFAQNVYAGGNNFGDPLPPNNTQLATIAAMKFVDATVFAETDPHYADLDRAKLASDSPLRVSNGYVSDDGKDAGCDIDALKTALNGVEATSADGLPS